MLDGSSGTGASPERALVDGTAAAARERSRQLREQLSANRTRLTLLRRSGLDGRARPDPTDLVQQVQEQLNRAAERIGHLEVALRTNRRIGIAIGIVMARHQVTDEQAFDLLREQSQVRNRKLRDLAEDVIYTGSL